MKTGIQTAPSSTFRFNDSDKAVLKELSKILDMNRTAALRVIMRDALEILKERGAQNQRTASHATPRSKT